LARERFQHQGPEKVKKPFSGAAKSATRQGPRPSTPYDRGGQIAGVRFHDGPRAWRGGTPCVPKNGVSGRAQEQPKRQSLADPTSAIYESIGVYPEIKYPVKYGVIERGKSITVYPNPIASSTSLGVNMGV
jgi:hypothetical protein